MLELQSLQVQDICCFIPWYLTVTTCLAWLLKSIPLGLVFFMECCPSRSYELYTPSLAHHLRFSLRKTYRKSHLCKPNTLHMLMILR